MRLRPFAILALSAVFISGGSAAERTEVKPGVRTVITIPESPPQSGPAQLKLRLHQAGDPAAYDVSQERFEILVPKRYKDSEPHGLFIWISPGEKPSIASEWEKVLAEKKLIFVGAFNSGNNRETPDRVRMAVDANDYLRQHYAVDPERVYVAGHSGGARVASMVGVAYADMFTGAACFMGVNYFRNLTGKDGTAYDMRYFPHPEIATIAVKDNRFALVTGEKDFNRDNTRTLYEEGFKADGFQGVKLFDIPGQGHGAPSAEWLEKVVEYLDKGK